MERLPNFEQREAEIYRLIEELAEREGMKVDDILSDIDTFVDIYKEDDGAKAYFEELAEKLGISVDEMIEYANRKASK